jgi:hypothetical protein
MALVNALLVCALCGIGFRTFVKHRTTAKKPWFTKPDTPAQKVRVPFFTCVYVARCWQELTTPGREIVMRYALDTPATGQRRGFTSPEALLDALSMELASAQEAQSSAQGHLIVRSDPDQG